jgi:hypothetical protein
MQRKFRADFEYRKLDGVEMEIVSFTRDLSIPKQINLGGNLAVLQRLGFVRAHATEDVVAINLGNIMVIEHKECEKSTNEISTPG